MAQEEGAIARMARVKKLEVAPGMASGQPEPVKFNQPPAEARALPGPKSTALAVIPDRATTPVGGVLAAAAPAPASTAMIPTGQPRGMTPPYGASLDPKTIYQPSNTSAPGRALAVTGDAGRATQGINIPRDYTPPKVNQATGAYANQGPAVPAPTAAPGSGGVVGGALGRANSAFSAFTGGNGPSEMTGKVAQGLKSFAGGAAKLAGKVATPIAVGKEGYDVAKVAADPNASGIDVATQTAQGAGRLGAAGLGAAAGAATLSRFGLPGIVVGGIGGGVLGYKGADKAIEAGRRMAGVDVAAPASRAPGLFDVPAQDAVAPARAAAQPPAEAQSASNPFADAAQAPAAPAAPAANPNTITAERQPNGVMSFSGGPNIGQDGGQISYAGSGAARMSKGFGVSTIQSGAQPESQGLEPAAERMTQPITLSSENSWQKRNDLRNLEVSASSFVNNQGYGGKRGLSPAQAAYNAALEQDVQARYGADAGTINANREFGNTQRTAMQEAGANQREGARLGVQRQELGIKAQGAQVDRARAEVQLRAAQQMEGIQRTLLDPSATPAQRKLAQSTLAALNGKTDGAKDRYITTKGGEEMNPDGMTKRTVPERIFDAETGQFVEQVARTKPIVPPQQAAAMLKANPKLAADFDAKYGAGASAQILGQK